jgi:hypothetical protein
MEFGNPDQSLSESDVANAESEVGLVFPTLLREFFLNHNGAEPEPYVLENDDLRISTVVSRSLPLVSRSGNGTAIETYRRLIEEKKLAPRNYFPFAVDGGGDYFLINCDNGMVSFLKSDSYPDMQLLDLGVDLAGFWELLQEE